MKSWNETIASECRYGDCAEEIFEHCWIIWEDSYADYQGNASVLAYHPRNEEFYFYAWSYGSCSGCDTWEAQGLSDEQIVAEMRRDMSVFKSMDAVRKFFDHEHGQETLKAFEAWVKHSYVPHAAAQMPDLNLRRRSVDTVKEMTGILRQYRASAGVKPTVRLKDERGREIVGMITDVEVDEMGFLWLAGKVIREES